MNRRKTYTLSPTENRSVTKNKVVLHRLTTLTTRIFLRELGAMPPGLQTRISAGLRELFGFN